MSLRGFLRRRSPAASPANGIPERDELGISSPLDLSDQTVSCRVNEPEYLLAAAELALRERDHGEAIRLYKQLAKLHPNYLPGYLSAIVGLLRAGHYTESYAYLIAMERRFALEDQEFVKVIRTELNHRDPLLLRHGADLFESRAHDESGVWGEGHSAERPLSLRPKRPVAHVYTVTFFDMDGQYVYPGGAERYIVDLARVLDTLGIGLEIFQAGRSHWKRQMGEIAVHAIPWRGSIYQLSIDFGSMTRPGFINIYSPFTLAVAEVSEPSIGICHGVYWDTEGNSIFVDEVARDVFSALLHLDQCVSVDATSINVIRATRPDLAREMRYIPNYAGEEFFRVTRTPASNDRLRVLYPRRLYGARGYWLLAEIVPELITELPNIEIIFLGDSDPKERAHVSDLVARYPEHVKHRSAFPEEMASYYADADIVLVPTVNSEGTSLSALEALAAGAAVIASDVGGLSNIILDEHNGLLIAPTAAELKAAVLRLARDKALRLALQQNAKISAQAFTKGKWARAWTGILEECKFEMPHDQAEPESPPYVIFHPRTDGITWSNDGEAALPRQRPHHLLQALAMLGVDVTIIEDADQKVPIRAIEDRLEILGKDAQAYLHQGVIFVYYAYHVWALGDVGAKWLETLPDADRHSFESTRHSHALRNLKTWFDLIDHPTLHENPLYARAVELFIDHADYVSTSSRVLYELYRSRRPDIILLENACWPSQFARDHLAPVTKSEHDVIGTIEDKHRKGGNILGYVGAIARWFDFALVERLAREFPTDEIIIVGRVSKDVEHKAFHLNRLSNVTFVGEIPYADVPRVLAKLDIAILPFHINEVTDVTNPLKLFEYLASGLPVVATRLKELVQICPTTPGLVHLADSVTEFLTAIAEAKASLRRSFSRQAAQNFASINSWLHRAAVVAEKIVGSAANFAIRDPEWSRRQIGMIAYNRENAGRLVAGSIGPSEAAPILRFTGTRTEPGDVVGVRFPVYAPQAGKYRIDLLLRADGGEACLIDARGWTVFLGERSVAKRTSLPPSDVTRVLHIDYLPAGIHYVDIRFEAFEECRAADLGYLEIERFEMSTTPPGEEEKTILAQISNRGTHQRVVQL